MRRLLTMLILVVGLLVVALLSGGVLASNKTQAGLVPPLNMPKIYASLASVGARATQWKDYVVGQVESLFHSHKEGHHEEQHQKVVVTSPMVKDVVITQSYVCQIHAQRHIDICAVDNGYLLEIKVREGQRVKKGDVMFTLLPVLYKAKLDAAEAEARLADLEYKNTKRLSESKLKVVSDNEVLLFDAKRAKAKAEADLALAEFNFTKLKAPFDGIVDKLHEREGSSIKENDVLTTLSDNSLMWVYFNVPEAAYLDYMAHLEQHEKEDKIELKLANQKIFPQPGKIGAIEAKFNNETGNIPFRADFPNPNGVLRHGQTGTILIHRTEKGVVIPQRAIFELLDKQYVWVVGKDDLAHQRLITIKHELEDIFVINSGLEVGDKIVLEGIRQVEEGGKVEYDFRKPEEALKNQKFHAE